jgi:hypothetical protein
MRATARSLRVGPELPAPPVPVMTTMSARSTLLAPEAAEPDAPQADTTPAPDPEPKTKPAVAEKKPKPPAKEVDQPKVRGPIEFDSQKTPTESPSSSSGEQAATDDTSATETKSTTTPDSTSSPGSETKDAA